MRAAGVVRVIEELTSLGATGADPPRRRCRRRPARRAGAARPGMRSVLAVWTVRPFGGLAEGGLGGRRCAPGIAERPP